MRGSFRHWFVRSAVAAVLALSALPTIRAASNPQHLDMARALASGSVWISDPSVAHDLGRVAGRWYSPFPPLPALLALPLLIFGAHAHTAFNLMIVTAAVLAVFLAGRLGDRVGGRRTGSWAAVALGLGSGLWSATAIHDTYHSAHVLAVLAVLAALDAVVARPRRPLCGGLLLGIAALARQATVLATPVLAGIVARGPAARRRVLLVGLAVAVPMSAYLGLNALRFGSPLATGYGEAQHHQRLRADLERHGAFSTAYLPRNLHTMLLATPRRIAAAPWLVPDPNGMSLLLVSPWLLLALWPLWRPDRPPARRLAAWCWLAAVLISVPHLLYVNSGWVQFGYRFALDGVPFLVLAAMLAVRRSGTAFALPLLGLAVIVNGWGFYCLLTWARWSPFL